ncbi:uncharacterized protein BDR25DRAFT_353907 [Lindgomyces ingoldianus]|uniref:Uncharacterized protein n=1 Tax=Lindgomyces ingoldianus TaxID=673940 RepID=A0ACB6QYX4_9PLEO|nr:uncharacterized protein BDR25DRAFT_353907 [Lindgomyces ingoldianus]KAF2472198.1 hypothetical protein BDR25DRAFT_353907 [Lindgomyces ingoldianus]
MSAPRGDFRKRCGLSQQKPQLISTSEAMWGLQDSNIFDPLSEQLLYLLGIPKTNGPLDGGQIRKGGNLGTLREGENNAAMLSKKWRDRESWVPDRSNPRISKFRYLSSETVVNVRSRGHSSAKVYFIREIDASTIHAIHKRPIKTFMTKTHGNPISRQGLKGMELGVTVFGEREQDNRWECRALRRWYKFARVWTRK